MSKVIGFHYTLKNKLGVVIDSSVGHAPMMFLEGHGQIIPGLEREILSLEVGDKKNVKVTADEAYGAIQESLQIAVNKDQFPPDAKLKIGDQFQVNQEPGAPVFKVVKIEGDTIHIDGNHPLAGVDLFFDIEITENRRASKEEMSHGHVHGPGGHHH